MGSLLVLGVTWWHSYYDLKTMYVPDKIMGIGLGISFLELGYRMYTGECGLTAIFTGMIPFIAMLFVAFFSGHQIGYGDVFELWIIGNCLGARQTMGILIVSLLLGTVYCTIMLFRKKVNGKTRYAFLPFLTAGSFVWILGNYIMH